MELGERHTLLESSRRTIFPSTSVSNSVRLVHASCSWGERIWRRSVNTLIIVLYFVVLLTIGIVGSRFLRGTSESYFLANRTIGPFVLLMSLFGTQMTAFALLGSSGEAYHRGIAVFAMMASSSALIVPMVFHFLGRKIRVLGQRLGCLTQIQFFRARWQSEIVSGVLLVFILLLLIPYLLIGVMGAGITFNQITAGVVPEWMGSLIVCVVVFLYVVTSGLGGTSWVNTFQTLVFMTLGVVTFVYVSGELGGLGEAMHKVQKSHPQLLIIGGGVTGLELLSYLFIPLSAAMFPHLFMHWLSARAPQSFRLSVIAYPICICVLWIPTVLIGVMARIPFPNLAEAEVNSVLIRMIQHYSPDLLAGFLAAGVLAAIMSSLDSQVLAVSTIFTQDVVLHYGFHNQMSERIQVFSGRLFVALILASCFLISRFTDRSIFSLGIWSFTGFSALLPVLLAALFWRRSSKWGALASIVVTAVLWVVFFWTRLNDSFSAVGLTGLLPVVVILPFSTFAMIVVSLLTSPPNESTLEMFFPRRKYSNGEKMAEELGGSL